MSHFSVAVILKQDDNELLEKALAPYQENNMGDCPKEFMEFQSSQEELLEEFNDGTTEVLMTSEGVLLTEEQSREVWPDHSQPVPEGYVIEEVPYKELYESLDAFVEAIDEGHEKDPDSGEWGHYYNPNSKWDWYTVGGRWDGCLTTKDGKQVNVCKIKDLDSRPDGKTYNNAIRFWEIVVEGQPLKEGEEQPFNMYKPEYYTEMYGTKENYATNRARFSTYAIIDVDGKWHAQGEMGWFGMDNTTPENMKSYEEIFDKILAETDPEWFIVMVDCHI